MKTLFNIICIFFCSGVLAFADEIYLKDSSVIKCKVTQVFDTEIEYIREEGNPFMRIPKQQVLKIRYDNGDILQIAEAGSAKENEQAPAVTENQPEKPKEEYGAGSGGFIDSFVRLSAVGGGFNMYGGLDDNEEDLYKSKRRTSIPLLTDPNIDDDGPYTYHYGLFGGAEIDLMFPAIKYPQVRAFDLTGIKFGLKANYIWSVVHQDINDDSLPRGVNYDGRLLRYSTVNAGPEMNIIFSPKKDIFNMVVQIFALGGYIHNGRLTAAPGLRDAGLSFDKSEYAADFKGYSITAGAGLFFTLNRWVPLTLGYNLFYSYSRIKFNKDVPQYGNSDSSSFHGVGAMLSVGVFF